MARELEAGGTEGVQGICVFDAAFDTDPEELAEFDESFPYKGKREHRKRSIETEI